jgi:hypothetical protein
MQDVEKAASVVEGVAASGAAGKLAPALVVTGLIALAGAFWAVNGASVFAELVSSAWALCF